jgi:hypothetical protein
MSNEKELKPMKGKFRKPVDDKGSYVEYPYIDLRWSNDLGSDNKPIGLQALVDDWAVGEMWFTIQNSWLVKE